MSALSNYLENALLNHVLRNTAMSSPTTVYLALFTSDPGEAGGGTELSGDGYARQSVAFDAPSDGVADNTSDIEFPQATGDWGEVTHVGLFDAETAGNLLWYGALTASKTINTDDQFVVSAGDLDVSLA